MLRKSKSDVTLRGWFGMNPEVNEERVRLRIASRFPKLLAEQMDKQLATVLQTTARLCHQHG